MKYLYDRLRIASLAIAILALAIAGVGCGSGNDSTAEVEPLAMSDDGPGEQATDDTGILDWCAEHAVPESACTRCNPTLIEQFKTSADWCGPHDLPESHCRLCNPDISFPQEEILRTRSMESADNKIEVSLWFRPNAQVCATNGALIQFASAKTPEKTGLSVQSAQQTNFESTIEAPAEVVFDELHSNIVSSTVPALVSRWLAAPGDQVRKGQVLAILSSPEIAELQSRLLSAHAAHEMRQREIVRHEELKAASLISDADYEQQIALGEQAQAEYTAARGLLNAAGISDEDIGDVLEQGLVSNSFALRTTTGGVLVERIAQLGELLDAGGAFAMLADPSSMWIEARLTEEQLRLVEVGQTLLFASDGRGMDRVGAEVIWVSRYLDRHSRTGTVRARVVDPNHKLQAGEFGRVTIMQPGAEMVTLVPKDAVQWEGCCNVVFVKETDLRYRPRKVELLGSTGPFYQVTGDVKSGDDVVVDGAFLLKTELKKASLGSGCCGIEPTG